MNKIGNRVKMVRKDLHMNQEEFGQWLGGLKKSSISKIERSQNGISQRNIDALCSVFHVNREWLLTGNGQMYSDLPKSEEVIDQLIQAFSNDPRIQDKQKRFFFYLSKLTDDQWDTLTKVSYSMYRSNQTDLQK